MPEILTESFCERCGTRYTFQSSAPKVGRLTKMKVLSRGFKNYVLSDEASLDEALADARSLDDRQQSVEQLDAFHKTFNFCMSCRQYTCGNCWNEREGRCFSCAPSLSVGVLPSSFPELNPVAGGIGTLGLAGNGHDPGNGHVAEAPQGASAWPQADLAAEADQPAAPSASIPIADKPLSRLEALFGREEAARIQAGAPKSESSEPEMIGLEGRADDVETDVAAIAAVDAETDATPTEAFAADEPDLEAAAQLATVEPDVDEALAAMVADEPPVEAAIATLEPTEEPALEDEAVAAEHLDEVAAIAAVEETDETGRVAVAEHLGEAAAETTGLAPEPMTVLPVDPETDELAAAAAAQTHGLLDKFRAMPIDLPAPRPRVEPAPVTPTYPQPPFQVPATPAAPQVPYAAVGPQSAAVPPAPQPYGLAAPPPYAAPAPPPYTPAAALPYAAQAPQPYAGQPQQPYAPPSAQPYPAPAAAPSPFPTAPSPYSSPPAPYPQFAPPQYAAPAPPPPAPAQAPSWRMVAPESQPLGAGAPSPNGRVYDGPPPEPQWPTAPAWPAPLARTSRTRGAEAVWAESTRDLLNRPDTGVSACFNCGLPLSATARFCRRCGTSQVSS